MRNRARARFLALSAPVPIAASESTGSGHCGQAPSALRAREREPVRADL